MRFNVLFAYLFACGARQQKKHVVFMFADDLGWNDVSIHGNSQIPTPAIDKLAQNGVLLDQYYVQPVCSPSRATLMTGRHVINTGVYTAFGSDASGDLNLAFTLLPQHLAKFGFTTHMVGKWHLGFSSWKYTPLYRGFDSFMGYLGGAQDYWLHGFSNYLDFCEGTKPAFNHTCWHGNACALESYSTHLFTKRAVEIIEASAGSDKSLFLYIAWQAVHSVEGPTVDQLKAPQSYIDGFNSRVSHEQRRIFAGMVRALDEGVANVSMALERTGIYNDTLIIFSTDNGGPADGIDHNMASNWPLRGTKSTLFEGGVRGVGIVSGGAIPPAQRGAKLDGLIHVADWFPTILAFAAQSSGYDTNMWDDILRLGSMEPPFGLGDGQNLLNYIVGSSFHSPRTEVLLEAHPLNSTDGIGNALRVGDWKVILRTGHAWPTGGSGVGPPDGWLGGPNSSDLSNDGYDLPIGSQVQPWSVQCPRPPTDFIRNYPCEAIKGVGADQPQHACLFNVREDPCEQVDKSQSEPAILQRLLHRLEIFRNTAVDSEMATRNPDGPSCPFVRPIEGCQGGGSQPPMNCDAKLPCDTILPLNI